MKAAVYEDEKIGKANRGSVTHCPVVKQREHGHVILFSGWLKLYSFIHSVENFLYSVLSVAFMFSYFEPFSPHAYPPRIQTPKTAFSYRASSQLDVRVTLHLRVCRNAAALPWSQNNSNTPKIAGMCMLTNRTLCQAMTAVDSSLAVYSTAARWLLSG